MSLIGLTSHKPIDLTLDQESHFEGTMKDPIIITETEVGSDVEVESASPLSPNAPTVNRAESIVIIEPSPQTPVRNRSGNKLDTSSSFSTPPSQEQLWKALATLSPRVKHSSPVRDFPSHADTNPFEDLHRSFSPSSDRSLVTTDDSSSSMPADKSNSHLSTMLDSETSDTYLEPGMSSTWTSEAQPRGFPPVPDIEDTVASPSSFRAMNFDSELDDGSQVDEIAPAILTSSKDVYRIIGHGHGQQNRLAMLGNDPSQHIAVANRSEPLLNEETDSEPKVSAAFLEPVTGVNGDDLDCAEMETAQDYSEEPSQAPSIEQTQNATCKELDEHLRTVICKPLLPCLADKLKKDKTGCVYIVKNMSLGDNLWKIGTTDDDPVKRADKLTKDCGVTIQHHHSSLQIKTAMRAEDLCHTHLRFFNRIYSCAKCKTKKGVATRHREYFELELATAKDYVNLWSSFLGHMPYGGTGKLHEFWRKRLQQVPKPLGNEGHGDHKAQLERWRSFVTLNDAELNTWRLSMKVGIVERLCSWGDVFSSWLQTWYDKAELWRSLFVITAFIATVDLRGSYGVCGEGWMWGLFSRTGIVAGVLLCWFYFSGMPKTSKT
jgi:hypothetical protein